MNNTSYKRATMALGILCALLLVFGGYCTIKFVLQVTHIAFAEEQVQIFEAMRLRAMDVPTSEAASFLNYVVTYYPSGTKQEAGSKLDHIVEQARASAIRDIVAVLRNKTGEDLGDDPQRWIHKFNAKQ